MARQHWLKLWHDLPRNRRLRGWTREMGPVVGWVWVVTLVMANDESKSGRLEHEGVPYTLYDVADEANVPVDWVESCYRRYVDGGWLLKDGDCYQVANFNKRNVDPVTLRTREHRARKQAENRSGNVPGTPLERPEEQKNRRTEEQTTENTPPPPSRGARARKPVEQVEVPSWVPAEAWEGFCDMRRRKDAKGWSPRAQRLAIGNLEKLRAAGNDPAAVLDQSVANGWKGLFEVKGSPMQAAPVRTKNYYKAGDGY